MQRRALLGGALAASAGLAQGADDTALPGRPVPGFALPRLDDPARRFGPEQLRGRAWVLNLWASWCRGCRDEHPLLLGLARRGVAPLVGIAFSDTLAASRAWLQQHGNPYAAALVDADGRLGRAYRVVGVPATYAIDRDGVLRLRLDGPLTQERIERELLPLWRTL